MSSFISVTVQKNNFMHRVNDDDKFVAVNIYEVKGNVGNSIFILHK